MILFVGFIFACPVKVTLKSCCLRISEISLGNLLKKSNFSRFASSLKLCNKQRFEKTFLRIFSNFLNINFTKHMLMFFSEPKNSSCKSRDGSGTSATSKIQFFVTLVLDTPLRIVNVMVTNSLIISSIMIIIACNLCAFVLFCYSVNNKDNTSIQFALFTMSHCQSTAPSFTKCL